MTWVIKFENGSYNRDAGFEVLLNEATQYDSVQAAEAASSGLMGVKDIVNVGVHVMHCCAEHGCKYGDDDCPVVAGYLKQAYDCEECVEEKHDPAKQALDGLVEACQNLVDTLDFEHTDSQEYERLINAMKWHLMAVKHKRFRERGYDK